MCTVLLPPGGKPIEVKYIVPLLSLSSKSSVILGNKSALHNNANH